MRKKLRRFFITGILIILPGFISVYIIVFLFTKVGNASRKYLTPLLNYFGFPDPPFFLFSALGFIIIMGLIVLTGMLARNYFGRKIVSFGENLVARIPLISKVYLAAKQFLEAFAFKEKDAFRQIVMVEYPRKGIYSLGFLTAKTQEKFQQAQSEEMVNIFMPTTPNPTSGMLILVPKKDIIPIDVSAEDGLKFIVSGGIVYSSSTSNNYLFDEIDLEIDEG